MDILPFGLIAQAGVITDAPTIGDVLSQVLDFLLSVGGVLGILGLVFSGVLYFTAGGDEERIKLARRATTYSVIGIAVILGALVLVRGIASFFD